MNKSKSMIKENSSFSVYEIIDWYDGAICGMGNFFKKQEHYFFQFVAYNAAIDEKIFMLIMVEFPWENRFISTVSKAEPAEKPAVIKLIVDDLLKNNTKKITLLKAKDIENEEFELKELRIDNLRFYGNSDSVFNQNETEKQKWFAFFS